MNNQFNIHPNIAEAETLPAQFYRSEEIFQLIKEKVFLKSWQWIGSKDLVPFEGYAHPFILLEGYLTEPLAVIRTNDNALICLSNVCTHRGNIVVQQSGKTRNLSCMYHGRQFNLCGEFEFMPEFAKTKNFPRPCDDLPRFKLEEWGPFLFVGLAPSFELKQVINKMNERVGFLPLNEFKEDRLLSREYLVNAHWALYCDNYLEGFHIPFVHNELNQALDYGTYTTILEDHMSLQIGYAEDGVESFSLPANHPDAGKNVAAYYYWVFPNMMFNFYPWGLSINIVKPIGLDKTKVQFISYVYDSSKMDGGAGAILDKVEREDEFVVESVQKGIRSNFYKAGRFSPDREQGVHHFHKMLAKFLNQ
jgi:choline monooxygenase